MKRLSIFLILAFVFTGCASLSDTKAPPSAPAAMKYGAANDNYPTYDSSTKAADFPGAVVIDGAVTMGTPYLAVTGSDTLTAAEVQGYVITLTGDGTTATLPIGTSLTNTPKVTFYIGDATAKHIDINAANVVILRGVTLDAGDKISIAASNTGKAITLFWDGTNWLAPNAPGEFTDGG